MATLLKSVDKTNVTFLDYFNYTISVAFSGTQGDIDDAKITEFIPSYISYTLPQSIPYVQSITTENVDGGKLITFNFGQITDLGISVNINISCRFNLGTDSQTTFTNESILYINNQQQQSALSEPVTLNVSENFVIEKDIAVPSNKISTFGGRVIYTITIENILKSQGGTGDPGAKITDVLINDVLPEGLTIDENFTILGRDISNNQYADTRYDGRIGSIENGVINFTLPDYYGTKYRIRFICNVTGQFELGDEIQNTATLYIQQLIRDSATSTLIIGNPTYIGNIIKYGPNYASVGNDVSFEFATGNYGNQDLLNFTIEDKIPDEVTVYRINTGNFKIDVLNTLVPQPYTIEYKTNLSQNYQLLGNFNTQNAQYVNLPQVGENEKITNIRWNIPNFAVGMISNQKIIIDGIVTKPGDNNQFTNIGEIRYSDETGINIIQATHLMEINDKSELNLSKAIINNTQNVSQGEIIRYSLRFNGNGSQINNPVVSELLSDKLTYVGNEKYTYYDYFTNQIIEITDTESQTTIPIVKEVIQDYNNTGRTLITYNMDGFSLKQKGYFIIELDTMVKQGATGSITNNAIIGNKGNNAVVAPGQIAYIDTDDRDLDGITDETIVSSNTVTSNIAYSVGVGSNKLVKGALDETYTEEPNVGLTYEGGSIDYKLVVTNEGNLSLNYLQIVDIFPHIGDTGVILTNENRDSQFTVYNTDVITANIVENNTVVENVNLIIEYSKSYNPLRFSQSNYGDDTIGEVDDWSTTVPDVITDVKSIRITMQNQLLLPNQSLIIDIHAIAPIGAQSQIVAWNSYAVKARYIDENGVTKKLIPIEPEKVGVRILENQKASISGKAWLDSNENGNIDADELGLNDIKVILLSENKQILKQTITTNDFNGNPGYYIFNNLDIGNYYVQFTRPQNLYFTRNTLNTQNKADTNTGITSKLSITTENQKIENISGGYIQELNIILMLLEILNNNIYSVDCGSLEEIISSINFATSSLLNLTNLLINMLNEDILNGVVDDSGYKAQLQRLVYTLQSIKSKLTSLIIPNEYCNILILSNILYVLAEYSIELICIIEKNESIKVYYNKCGCIGNTFYEIIIGRFINDITKLDHIVNLLNNILGTVFADMNGRNKSYVPTFVPKENIVIPQYKGFNLYCPQNNKCNR